MITCRSTSGRVPRCCCSFTRAALQVTQKDRNRWSYVVSSVQRVEASSAAFVFSDGHGIATFTKWFDDLADLKRVDWNAVNSIIWKDVVEDMDRQRRKQAEFLVHQKCDWSLVEEIGVVNSRMKAKIERILSKHDPGLIRPVCVRAEWYY